MSYLEVSLNLTKSQIKQLLDAFSAEKPAGVTLSLKPHQLDAPIDKILVTAAQKKRILGMTASKKQVTITLSARCVAANKAQVGSGILDSLAGLFNTVKTGISSAATSVGNSASRAWRNVKAAVTPAPAPPQRPPTVYTDNGPRYDYKPPGWKPKPKSTFDKVAESVSGFDKKIDRFFDYGQGRPSGIAKPWKEQKLAYDGGPAERF